MTFLVGAGVLIGFLLAYATHIALSATDKRRRFDAYRVLRVLCLSVGVGCLSVVVRLHAAGVL